MDWFPKKPNKNILDIIRTIGEADRKRGNLEFPLAWGRLAQRLGIDPSDYDGKHAYEEGWSQIQSTIQNEERSSEVFIAGRTNSQVG